jgi:hypothetical protein
MTARTFSVTVTAPPPPPSGLISVGFDTPPSGTIYTGSLGSVTIDVSGTSPATPWEHVPSGGFGGGGAVRFYGSQTGGGVYRGFYPNISTAGQSQINVRFLNKWNSAFSGTATGFGGGASNLKGNYFSFGGSPFWTQEKDMNNSLGAAPLGYFQLAQSYNGTLYRVHGGALACGAQSAYPQAGCDANSSKWGTRPFLFGEWVDQWVCFEYELRANGTWKIYVTTQNRAYAGQYMESRNGPTGAIGIAGLGGMFFHDSGAAAGSYMMVDHFVLSTGYIGPPAGF